MIAPTPIPPTDKAQPPSPRPDISTPEAQRALAAERYPREWAAAEALTGKRRQNRMRALRDRVVFEERMKLLPEGAHCGSCRHFETHYLPSIGTYCELRTDFYGFGTVKACDVCPEWAERPAQPPSLRPISFPAAANLARAPMPWDLARSQKETNR